jgi:AcrR family transcriptional regulator
MGLRERKKLETWHAIRAAAMRLFAERGYSAVNIDEISEAANVSRTTFFNYFASKEAVIRDPAPGERESWQHLFERPTDEHLWASIVAILIGFSEHISNRIMAEDNLDCEAPELALIRLERDAPELALIRLDRKHPIYEDLTAFVESRTQLGQELEAALYLNVALAAAETAYEKWSPVVGFPEFLTDALHCLDRVGDGLAERAASAGK